MKLQHRAEQLADQTFLGGRADVFEAMGRLQLIMLLRCGVYPDSHVLDLGCGCLRGGYWLIHFLRPDRYFGIEPNVNMLELGKAEILDPEIVAEKHPQFLFNDQFDPSEFGVRFDFFIARSIWTHASREQVGQMLDAFVSYGADDAVFLTSFLPADGGQRGDRSLASDWVGRSHESDTPGMVTLSREWIEQQCGLRNLEVRELSDHQTDRKEKQVWLLIAKGSGAEPSKTYLKRLAFGGEAREGLIHSVVATVGAIFRRLTRLVKRDG